MREILKDMKERLNDPMFLMFECFLGLWILESVPSAVFGLNWKTVGFLLAVHSAVTMLYIFLRDHFARVAVLRDLQRRRVMKDEE